VFVLHKGEGGEGGGREDGRKAGGPPPGRRRGRAGALRWIRCPAPFSRSPAFWLLPDPPLLPASPAASALLCAALQVSAALPARGAVRLGGASAGARLLWGAEGPDVTSPSCRGFAWPGWAGAGVRGSDGFSRGGICREAGCGEMRLLFRGVRTCCRSYAG